jgi:hypothetical protein
MPRNTPERHTLEAGLALYQAMYEELESGNRITDAQLGAVTTDRVLGILFRWAQRYACHEIQQGRMSYIKHENGTFRPCLTWEAHEKQFHHPDLQREALTTFLDQTLAAALTPSPYVLRWRRSEARRTARRV